MIFISLTIYTAFHQKFICFTIFFLLFLKHYSIKRYLFINVKKIARSRQVGQKFYWNNFLNIDTTRGWKAFYNTEKLGYIHKKIHIHAYLQFLDIYLLSIKLILKVNNENILLL